APLDTESLRIPGVGGSHPGAFLATNLPKRKRGRKGLPEAHLVHTADNSQARFFVRPQAGLSQKPSGAARLSHPLGVKANSLLAAPSHEATALGKGADRRMRDTGTRSQHQQAQGGTRHVDTPFSVMYANPFVFLVDSGVFNIQITPAITDLWKDAEITHASHPLLSGGLIRRGPPPRAWRCTYRHPQRHTEPRPTSIDDGECYL